MPIKRNNRALDTFSMASMTDVIFLLLIFFMVLSTLVVPNAIKINLPSSKSAPPSEVVGARITLAKDGICYLSLGKEKAQSIALSELANTLRMANNTEPRIEYAALYADEEVPYREIIMVLNAANEAGIQLLLATKVLSNE